MKMMIMVTLSQIHFISVMFSNVLAQQHKCHLMMMMKMMMVIIIIIIIIIINDRLYVKKEEGRIGL